MTESTLEPLSDDADDESENEVLYASDDDILYASDDDRSGPPSLCDDDVMFASDAEDIDKEKRGGRSYKKRRTESMRFAGQIVCQRAFAALLGIGDGTVEKVRKGQKAFTNKQRPPIPKHPVYGFSMDRGSKWISVVMFFFFVYHSVAEVLPRPLAMPRGTNFQETPFVVEEDFAYRKVNEYMTGLNAATNDPGQLNIGPGSCLGDKRYIQHSSLTELYWEYIAYSATSNTEPASYSVFLRLASKIVGKRNCQLGIRKSSEHAQCDTCFRLKTLIKQTRGKNIIQHYYRQYSDHILSQWLDRQVYWSFRALSRAHFKKARAFGEKFYVGSIASNVICCIADGMDQAKFRYPRTRMQASKLLSKLIRPMLHVAATWIHGHLLNIWVSDPDMKKDSTTQIEMLSRSLDCVFNDFNSLPAGFVLQQDNTYREGKNQYGIAFLILLVVLHIFRWTISNFLRPGHSHGPSALRLLKASYSRFLRAASSKA